MACGLLETNEDLTLELGHERSRTRTLSCQLNDLEQYSRRNNVRIFGVKDNKEETIQDTEQIVRDLLRSKLNLNFGPADFDICHRIGKFTQGAKRAIIVKFLYRKSKIVTIGNRRKLAKSGISISEDLTHKNVKRLQDIKNLQCVDQAWSRDGRLFAKDKKNFIKEVKPLDLLTESLFNNGPTTAPSAAHAADRYNKPHPSGSAVPTITSQPSFITNNNSSKNNNNKGGNNTSKDDNNNQKKVDGQNRNNNTINIVSKSSDNDHNSNRDTDKNITKRDDNDNKGTSPKTSPKKFSSVRDAPAIQTNDNAEQQMQVACTNDQNHTDRVMPTPTINDILLKLAEGSK